MRKSAAARTADLKQAIETTLARLESTNFSKRELEWIGKAARLFGTNSGASLDAKISSAKARQTYRYNKSRVKRRIEASVADLLRVLMASGAYDDRAWREMFPPSVLGAVVAGVVARQGLTTAQTLAGTIEMGVRESTKREYASYPSEVAQAFEVQVPVLLRFRPESMDGLVAGELQQFLKG